MDLYDTVAYENSRHLTLRYSTSFGISSRFFSQAVKPHIYAIYGLVRIADEVVDTYRGPDAARLLDDLEFSVYDAMKSGYSTNPIVHAFAKTARQYGISKRLIEPFFASMRIDLTPESYDSKDYGRYIHGSAQVIGLMCLRVFVDNDDERYDRLKEGASALGSAYQKINFLRDMAADYKELGRLYFPDTTFESFDDEAKRKIVADIRHDLGIALPALRELPPSSRKASMLSYAYYGELLKRLEAAPAATIKRSRIRVPSPRKFTLMVRTAVRGGGHA